MLPDLPDLKREIYRVQMKFLDSVRREEMGAFSGTQSHTLFEGHQHGIERETGDSETNDLSKVGGELLSAPHTDTIDDVFEKLYILGKSMGQEFQKQAFTYLDELLDRTGQTVSGGASADSILDMLSKIEFPLGKDGNLDMSRMTFVAGTQASKNIALALQEIENSVEKKEKMQVILHQKQENARAREANRKLVG